MCASNCGQIISQHRFVFALVTWSHGDGDGDGSDGEGDGDGDVGDYGDDDEGSVCFLLWADQRQGRGWEVVATSHSPMASTMM